MSRRRESPSLDASARQEVERLLDDLASSIAAELGPADGTVYASEEQEVAAWGTRDPKVDYDTLKAQLMTSTVPPDLYDTTSPAALTLVQGDSEAAAEWAQLIADTARQPLDEEMAHQVAEAAEWPYRLAILEPYQDDPESYVERADRIDARWRKRLSEAPSPEGGGY